QRQRVDAKLIADLEDSHGCSFLAPFNEQAIVKSSRKDAKSRLTAWRPSLRYNIRGACVRCPARAVSATIGRIPRQRWRANHEAALSLGRRAGRDFDSRPHSVAGR